MNCSLGGPLELPELRERHVAVLGLGGPALPSVSGYGSYQVVVGAPSEGEVTDEVVKASLPARFHATDVAELAVDLTGL